MKLFAWRWVAASSLVLAVVAACAETRPQYGGTLHIAMREALTSLDPAQEQTDASSQANVMRLIFETLVKIDHGGHVQPALAISWQSSPDNRHWTLRLRPGVKFHDGTVLTPEAAAASLRMQNPSWRIAPERDSIAIEEASPDSELLSELALPRNAIYIRDAKSTPLGTGPFHVVEWQARKRLLLGANDDYWDRRPFLDSIEVEMDKSFGDQTIAFQSGKADIIDLEPEQAQRVSIDRQAIHYSLPMELLGLVFTHAAQSPDERLLRQALALGIDRDSIGSVLLQGTAQPTGSLLPNWMTGYGFVFSNQSDVAQARHLREQVQSAPTWTLGYDGADPLSRLIAERISLNAKDAGLLVRLASTTNPDLQLMRVSMDSPDPWMALEELTKIAGLPAPAMQNDSVEDLYAAEQPLIASERIIPLFHLPVVYAISRGVKDSSLQRNGTLDLADVWLENRP